ncbi:tail spike protein [Escherichia phage vB_EcoM_ECO1230-10]|uniref:Conserved phage protein n=1 Tax=Escherichia phage vB_EcoM_ECO1230-10 TaxID=669875 RepID=D5LGZ1_9CAUD|nr:tail spike protein [Escherichia phage vB_EcoM_ECO1230-10]ADE87922.1 conserved phage protein [Escherichia phage vB_EcoM_ECO1230-10]
MELKTYFAQDRNGSLIPGATVTIYLTETTTMASGLKTVGGNALANPFTADADGKIQFRAPDGIYDMQVSVGTDTGTRVTFQCVDIGQQLSDANGAAERAESAAQSIEINVANINANAREQWRRTLADAGFNLVDGSFEEGATAQSVNDAVWHIAGGACYSWGGNLPKSVPEESTPEGTGGISTGAWNDLKSQTLRSQLGSNSGVSIVGGLEERLSLVDISKVSGTKDSAMLNSIFSAYRGRNVTLYSSVALTFNIDTDVTAYGNFDFSNLTFNLSGGKVIYADERDISEYKKTITLTNYPLVELTSVLPTSDVLEGWENSLVKIISPTEVDLYRLLNGVSTPRYKGEVNFMAKAGELAYTLKNTYNDAVTCTLYKLPNKRNKIVLPRITGQFNRFTFDIQRSLVDVEVVYANEMGMTAMDSNILGSSSTYGVVWTISSSGITQSDTNSRYSVLMEYTLKHTFNSSIVGKGWRSVDGNYCRDTVVRDCTMDSFNLHYGSSKILIDNCRIPNGLSFGTGAFDEATQIINSHTGPFGIRSDYGEHKGDFIVRGGSVRVAPDKTGIVDLFTCRCDNVISSGNPLQPRALNLPKNVIIATNIYWPDSVTLNIVSFKNNFKTQNSPLRDFVMPDVIDFTGSTFNGKTARFEWALSYHDATTRPMTLVKLTPAKSTGCKVTAYVGYQAEYATCLYGLESNMDMTFMNITSGMNRSYIRVEKGIMRRFVGYSGGTTYMQGGVYFDQSFIDWDTGNNPVAGFISFTYCLIDGTRAKGSSPTKPIVNAFVHRSANNICYDIVSTDSRDIVDKRFALCSREGAAGNYSAGEIPVYY